MKGIYDNGEKVLGKIYDLKEYTQELMEIKERINDRRFD